MPELNMDDFKQLSDAKFFNLPESREAVPGISTDSRTIQPGQVFWVLQGDQFNGHDFVDAVQLKKPIFSVISQAELPRFTGAKFAMIAVPDTLSALQELAKIHRQKFSHPVLALSGSNGKTSTKEMIAAILGSKFRVHKTSGNLNNHIGCPLTLLNMVQEHQVAVIEMGSNHPGEIETLAEIAQPDQALLTNIGAAHLEFFKNLENVAREKLSLFESLPADGLIYRNADDPFIQQYNTGGRKVVSFALDQKADVKGQVLELDAQGNGIFLLSGETKIHLNVPGVHNIHNAVAAAAVGLEFGLSASEIKQALEDYSSTSQRMQVLDRGGIRFINDAYNANPDSVGAAIEALSRMQINGSVFIVLGDMLELGSKSKKMHEQVIEQALSIHPGRIMVLGKEMRIAAAGFTAVEAFDTHDEIIDALQKTIRPGDLVLLKGSRYMQMENILNGFN